MQTTDTIQNSTVQPSSRAARGLGLVLAGGLIAGALDLTFAFVFYGQHGAAPLRILQGIASGVLGRGSFQMGLASAALGAFFHFFISVCAAAIYYLVSLRFSFLTRRVAISGAIFGVLMFLAMHFIVVPLSAIKPSPMKVGNVIGELCSHVFLFGMVIAYAVSRVKSLRTGQ
ncbi:MAG: hypothetical protein JWO04_2320 [Gammaproteobacteria bacterium]|jgi:hypothetical protein|nr:hypothetical protein [Gammaproteobacteria bacterium]